MDPDAPESAVGASLTRSERLAQIGRLTASVAHEINNPAAFVLTNQGLMLEQLEELEQMLTDPSLDRDVLLENVREMKEMCRDNRVGILRIAGIARELRNYARTDSTSDETMRINEAVQTAVTMVRNQVRYHADLVVTLGDVPGVVGDPSKIAQVVMNLVVNAGHAIRCKGDEGRGRIEVSTCARGKTVSIVVRDDGRGMPDDVRARIFEPFFTTKGLDDGTGLGLAISADIIHEHGGRIECESTLGQGTTFEIVLPAAAEVTPSVGESMQPPPSSQASRILVVDDDLRVARSIQRALEPPHRVVIATGGREALDRLATDRLFDIVICDVMMPGVDGITVYREACELVAGLAERFIFITGGAFNATAVEFLKHTTNPVCEKPLAVEELRIRVEASLSALRSYSAA